MKIKDIPWFNRPGFKLTRNGVSSLDDAELLSIIFGKGKKESVLDLANRLLKKYNLNKLEDCSLNELKKECNGDISQALKVLSVIELSKRYHKLVSGGYNNYINSAKDVFNRFSNDLRNEKQEKFIIVMLDNKNKVIGEEIISKGVIDSVTLHPREVFKPAIKNSAARVMLVHNHPSGNPKPSERDRQITDKLIDIGNILDIPVIDHIIIGNNRFWSWREEK